jgi:hypothetical protein
MTWSERIVRGHRRRTDYAIHDAFVKLATDAAALETFEEILYCVRKRAPRLFDAPVLNGHHAGVDALVNLSRFRNEHLRKITQWLGSVSSWRPAVSSLARHLICEYDVPSFLSSAWWANDLYAHAKRGWFVAHSRGASFRSLHLPIALTRRMEHIFLKSQDHMPIEYAMRRAELLALGMPPTLVKAILNTRLATDLRHGEFWRTFWLFLLEHADDVDPAQIGPLIDYVQAIRHDRIAVTTEDGIWEMEPPQPAFSVNGRTVQSMMRLMQAWHKSLGGGGAFFSWRPSPFQPWFLEESHSDRSEAPRRWHMTELTDSAKLRSEGAALHHCVATYAYRCDRGVSSIWTLRLWQGNKARSVLTVEVDPRIRAIVQARGRANRPASGRPLEMLREWAGRERLKIAI